MMFAERLKKLRLEQGLKQTEVSNILNYGYTAIANYESGRNQPSLPDLIRLAKFFDVTVDYLIGSSDVRLYFDYEHSNHNIRLLVEFYCASSGNTRKSIDDILQGITTICHNINLKSKI